MTNDRDIQNQVYQCFLVEAGYLLPAIEEDLLSFLEEPNINKIHKLMRNAHTLKGSAGSAERETIRTVAHHLEDVFKALYSPDLIWDEELSALLWECYECLRESVMAEMNKSTQVSPSIEEQQNSTAQETEILNRVAVIFAELHTKLGDFFQREAPLPTSEELGFDVIASIFAESMEQELQQLAAILITNNSEEVALTLSSEAEFFIGIGESYNLPGLKELAQTVLDALEQHPDQAIEIARLALEDFKQARITVLAGDRSRGGEPCRALKQLAQPKQSSYSKNEKRIQATLKNLFTSETEVTPDPKFYLKPLQRDHNDEQSDTIDTNLHSDIEQVKADSHSTKGKDEEIDKETPKKNNLTFKKATSYHFSLEEQDQDNRESRQSNTRDIINQTTPEIGFNPQESKVSQDSYVSKQPHSKQKKTSPKSTFSFPSSKKDVRVDVLQLERLNYIFGELLIKQNQQKSHIDYSQEKVQKTLEHLQKCEQNFHQMRDWANKYLTSQIGKLPQLLGSNTNNLFDKSFPGERFDALEMDAYSKMHVFIQGIMDKVVQLQENIEEVKFSLQESQLIFKKQNKLLIDARENLFQARMLPLEVLLNRFPPIIKHLATINHKPTNLELSGTEILIDKSISEKLFDPLLHLLRNAIAHGLESPQVRLEQGKPETGRIRIHAYHQGNRTTIEVADDGQGLDWKEIRARSVQQQLLDPNQAAMASESELAELLFEPGFSTAKQITNLSGRGVGLDVVRTQIQELEGSVTVRSFAGEGTVFSLHLPLVLMTAQMLLCESNGLPYALLAESIERVLQPEPTQISEQALIKGYPQQKFLLWEEGNKKQQVPITTLASLLAYSFPIGSLSASTPSQSQKVPPLLMLRHQDQLLCLEVDQIVTKQELAIKSLSKKPTLPTYIQGYSVLGDSRLVMALDPLELVNQTWSKFESSQQARIFPEPMTVPSSKLSLSAQIEPRSLPTSNNSSDRLLPSSTLKSTLPLQGQSILIIEDSLTQRKLLVLMLEKAGCYVLQAGDGQEALTQLRQHPEIKLIICDIEMPTVNGFEFLYTYRQDSTLPQVDVIMLTSRSGSKHREMAFELGAKAYLTKPYSEQELLNLLSELSSQTTPASI